jgi:hypothetical protein
MWYKDTLHKTQENAVKNKIQEFVAVDYLTRHVWPFAHFWLSKFEH